MPVPAQLRGLFEEMYEIAELSPDLQYSLRIKMSGIDHKVRIVLSDPKQREGTITYTVVPRD